jgi:uncharacterized protein (DUF1778 family)
MVDAAVARADQVIAESRRTVVPSAYFDRLLNALESPPHTMPALVKAAERVRLEPAFRQV